MRPTAPAVTRKLIEELRSHRWRRRYGSSPFGCWTQVADPSRTQVAEIPVSEPVRIRGRRFVVDGERTPQRRVRPLPRNNLRLLDQMPNSIPHQRDLKAA